MLRLKHFIIVVTVVLLKKGLTKAMGFHEMFETVQLLSCLIVMFYHNKCSWFKHGVEAILQSSC